MDIKVSSIIEMLANEFTIYYLIYKYLGHKIDRRLILCPVVTLLAIILLKLSNYRDFLYFVSYLVLYLLIPCIITKSKKYILIIIEVTGVLSLINAISYFVLSLAIQSDLIYSICNISANAVTVLCVILLSLNKNIIFSFKSFYDTSKRLFIIICIYIWELELLLSALTSLFIAYPHAQIATLVSILIVLSMVISFISFFLLISKNMKSLHYQSVNKLVEENFNEQVNYYKRLSQYNDSLRKFKHDYKNLQIGLLAQLKNGNVDEAVRYLNDCGNMIDDSNVLYHTGNTVIDALLFDKSGQIKDKNITINFNGLFPQSPMNSADLCAVFGNVVDNAIEACVKLPENDSKNIEIFLQKQQDYIFVSVLNPVSDSVEIKNNTVSTTKDNKKEHGIGLYSVKKILQKYDGHLSLNCNKNLFTTKFDFRIK